jgi:hypothetical protein
VTRPGPRRTVCPSRSRSNRKANWRASSDRIATGPSARPVGRARTMSRTAGGRPRPTHPLRRLMDDRPCVFPARAGERRSAPRRCAAAPPQRQTNSSGALQCAAADRRQPTATGRAGNPSDRAVQHAQSATMMPADLELDASTCPAIDAFNQPSRHHLGSPQPQSGGSAPAVRHAFCDWRGCRCAVPFTGFAMGRATGRGPRSGGRPPSGPRSPADRRVCRAGCR